MRRIILDVDTGTDDAVAIILAHKSKNIEVLGLTTVNGNRGIEYTTENTLRLVESFDYDTPVYKGCELPIASTLIKGRKDNVPHKGQDNPEENVHQDYLNLPISNNRVIEDINAVSWIVDKIKNSNEKITIVGVGPLTNIATALRIDPSIKNNIDKIIIMGGGYRENNKTPAAEFNFWVDPEAAKIVLESGCEITMVPLDATHKAAVSVDIVKKLEKNNNKEASFVAEIIKERLKGYNKWQPMKDNTTVPIHDALAICYLINPSVLEDMHQVNVDVDVSGGICDGQSVCDVENKLKSDIKNVNLALSANKVLFEDMIIDLLK